MGPSRSFNIEIEKPTIFNRSRESHFGQTVAQFESSEKWIIVGAPIERNQSGTTTGRVYKCHYTRESCSPLPVRCLWSNPLPRLWDQHVPERSLLPLQQPARAREQIPSTDTRLIYGPGGPSIPD